MMLLNNDHGHPLPDAPVFYSVLSVAAVFLLVRLLSTPLRWFWKLCINTLCGAVLLGLVNLLAPLTGLYIAVTAPAACIVGFFGLPGFAAVVLMQLFL